MTKINEWRADCKIKAPGMWEATHKQNGSGRKCRHWRYENRESGRYVSNRQFGTNKTQRKRDFKKDDEKRENQQNVVIETTGSRESFVHKLVN